MEYTEGDHILALEGGGCLLEGPLKTLRLREEGRTGRSMLLGVGTALCRVWEDGEIKTDPGN